MSDSEGADVRVERSAGGIVFRRLPGSIEVLLIRDSHDGWSFPKGRIESNETPVQAARRETKEEVGLTDITLVKHIGRSSFWFTDRWEQPGQKVRKTIDHFLFEAPSTATAQPEGKDRVQEVRWVPLTALTSTVTYRTLQPIASRVQQLLSRT